MSASGKDKIFNRYAVADALGQGHFIGILQFAAKGNATGNGSYPASGAV